MKKPPLFLLLLLLGGFCLGQNSPQTGYQPILGENPTQAKNVYLLSLIEQMPEVKSLFEKDSELAIVASAKFERLSQSLKDCGKDATCYPAALGFTDQEIDLIAGRIEQLAKQHSSLLSISIEHLAPSGMYQMNASDDAALFLANAWKQDAAAINHIIAIYGRGEKPNYPKIDSLGMNLNSSTYLANIQALSELVLVKYDGSKVFYQLTLGYAMDALAMARFERAGDFEPMTEHENKAALEAAKNTAWDQFDYPLILIPGAGTDNYLDSLSSGGVVRSQLAFDAYKKKKAPFILVSGGYVHPYKVLHNEAIEMKRYLLKLGVPESAILIDPHARHTTTNMRNTARIMFRYGFPTDRPSITVTTPAQSAYIYSDVMHNRCMKELGYHPYSNGKRLSATTAEFYPMITSFQIDTDEPLDP
ncbi:YdcF family protein [Algoriphagus aquimarinus]|uniref:YdcF family protein n=1 Tax=Algoriphagus aquimarinus TaxID=237018 RepID=UPI0030DCB7C1|tara:strand:+ start:203004 stop:204257 length:1254 start_codon:yes stop_codon:yes gene_type:complete